MKKEITGILFFFMVVFSLISLISFDPGDPCLFFKTGGAGRVNNLFGVFGANFAGILVGLFGIGAFWVPFLCLLGSLLFFGKHSGQALLPLTAGGFLLILTTGSLLALKQEHYTLFGSRFSAGGIVGIPLKSFVVHYSNPAGGSIILLLVWLIGFIMATGFSVVAFYRRCKSANGAFFDRAATTLIKLKERRQKKAKLRIVLKEEKKKKKQKTIRIKTPDPRPVPKPVPKQAVFEFMKSDAGFSLPSVNFLDDPKPRPQSTNEENLRMQSRLLEKKLEDFGVHGKVVTVTPGPVITTFEYEPAPGVKINRIVGLTDDLALALRAISIRIVAPIPGKAVIGVEIPNADRETVRFKEMVLSPSFQETKSALTLCLGKDIVGNPVSAGLEKMPHLLIAGATGTGKSVALNTMICSLLYQLTPDQVKLIMVDPKRIELSMYDGIPHLITPVVTDVKKATNALFWAVREMEHRYELLSQMKTRNIEQYNRKIVKAPPPAPPEGADEPAEPLQPLPYIVIIIDELADLMMVASRDVEVALTRLAQMARAAGLHLILATQRPSVDVLTGIIKANFPTRLTFQVSSKTDSRTIIDTNGAESLLGNGDMLFLPPGTARLQRIHGAYISEAELTRVVEFLKKQQPPDYDKSVIQAPAKAAEENGEKEYDERYDDAVALVTQAGQASISMVQRHLRIGYNRAARIIEMMEQEGIIGPQDGVKPREVLVRSYDDMS
ncbi:DNA translocase FtsK [Desulfosarcina ovata subsp. sediminis]|uniref:DNA translocase FtsK n=1 Tax=Desulfosarcina ovata subsp. sediminis TaxID=885957 RepID=A0A5K7ZQQ6_9BACT|nr:DNA translocase FtsK [Desulfosarcina ovata]BBO82180.1 DNA translocase FtsK [Desulfosarcina ovata subsp. sediminis]